MFITEGLSTCIPSTLYCVTAYTLRMQWNVRCMMVALGSDEDVGNDAILEVLLKGMCYGMRRYRLWK
ncbi:hypothetical protein Trydic_g1719 [Trypoxylus dichotomus]